MNIIGHNNILTFFENAMAADKLHHAYLFVGRPSLGKRTIAEVLAKKCFGNEEKPLQSNPDFYALGRSINEKTGKTKKNISIDEIHELRHFLQGKPFLHGKKIAIIDDAHLMSTGAMNALLKTLEEPRGDALIFLIAETEHALLETIRSRCQILYFYPVVSQAIEQALIEKKIDPILAKDMAEASLGYPGNAIRWVEDEQAYAWHTAEAARCDGLFGQAFYQQLAAVEALFAKKDDHIAARSELLTILDIWLARIRTHYAHTSSANVPKYDIVGAYSAVFTAKQDLLKNVHPRMLIERILLSFSHV